MINFILVYIIDFSGILLDMSKFLWKLNGRKWNYQIIGKPFGCSTCMTFWITLIYMLFYKQILMSLFIACVSAICTKITKNLINTFYLLADKINNIIK